MLVLNTKEMKECYSMRQAIDADKEALGLYSKQQSIVPLRTNISVDIHKGQSLYMPAYVAGDTSESLGVKIVSVYPENIKKNLPSVPASMVVIDPATGIVSAIMDGTHLTQLRTGAVQGAATELLSRKDAKIGALIGTGGQAESQLEAMITVRDLEEIRIFDIDYDRAKEFSAKVSERFSINARAAKTAQECVTGADIITTVTTSRRPTFEAAWIKKGAHINGVGSYTPEMCEIPSDMLSKADVIILDTIDGVLQEAGDFIQPFDKGELTNEIIRGELGQLVNGTITGRTSDDQITVFKTVGTAVLDVYVANEIVENAKNKGLGTTINI
ncbi:ornithine cyclodeaminase family protein [Vagococcus vulneris]|uniref:Ornithine cyclodeaminase family protein n=1 Tax=Vagococcus vulneris TaxID=1977869 RepID=A0A429ZX66_9ENTE|nr:ornithine cyclodeaminase family protein [Vagococcus vulneris]RST98433.1 ornithine cyclodeaminase family protein [Vagococcus vulneris]